MVWPGVALLLTTLASTSSATACATPSTRGAPLMPSYDNAPKGAAMSGKRPLALVLAVASLALIVVAAASAAPAAKRGGADRARHLDRRRLHRPAALLLRRDVEARGRDRLQAHELAGQGGRSRCSGDARGIRRSARGLKDGKTYTFTIKPGFKFSNGQSVTARSFVDAFNRFANPRMQSTGVQFLDIVQVPRP